MRVDAGLKLRLRLLRRGGSRSSGVPGLGLRLVVGLAGIVSRNRPGVAGDDDSSTVWRFCGSTDEVSHESKLSPTPRSPEPLDSMDSRDGARRWLRWLLWLRRLRLPDSSLVFEEIGRTTFVNDEAMDEMVPVAENPPLDDGGLFESMETFRVAGSAGLVLEYGTAFTRLEGERRPISNMLGDGCWPSTCERSAIKRTTRKSSCVTKDTASSADAPPMNPRVLPPSAPLLDREMSVATVSAAATTQRATQEPNNSPLNALELSFLLEMRSIHDKRASTADSRRDDIIAVIRVGDVGFERGSARMIWRTSKINEAVTATAPSTAEATGRDMLITMILVLDSYVTSDECCACQGLRQSGRGQAARHTRRAEVASKRERVWWVDP